MDKIYPEDCFFKNLSGGLFFVIYQKTYPKKYLSDNAKNILLKFRILWIGFHYSYH